MSERRAIGRTRLSVAPLGLGTVALGNYPASLPNEDALATVQAACEAGVTLFDTAPLYGRGLAERRLGLALHSTAAPCVIATKVGRLLSPRRGPTYAADRGADIFVNAAPFDTRFDYTYDGAMRSVEDSLQRLGLDHVDVVHIHNIDPALHSVDAIERMFAECMTGAYRALHALREQGVISAIGVGNNSLAMLNRFLETADFDCFMMAGHYNLLEQDAVDFLDACRHRHVSILLGSPFASGILASGVQPDARFGYSVATSDVSARVSAMQAVCARHGVALAAVALQFPLAHPGITAVVPGCASAEQVRQNVRALCATVPRDCWDELRSVAGWDGNLPLQGQGMLATHNS